MALKNSENDVEISFETVEKEEDEVQVLFFFPYNILIPESKIRIS